MKTENLFVFMCVHSWRRLFFRHPGKELDF
jgi:hypothetical protein